MSRSRKKTSISGILRCGSEKQDKRIANCQDRRVNKAILGSTFDETKLKNKRTLSDIWGMGKDGKRYFNKKEYPKDMRK